MVCDANFVILGGDKGSLRIWDLEKGMERRVLHDGQDSITSITATPSLSSIVTGSAGLPSLCVSCPFTTPHVLFFRWFGEVVDANFVESGRQRKKENNFVVLLGQVASCNFIKYHVHSRQMHLLEDQRKYETGLGRGKAVLSRACPNVQVGISKLSESFDSRNFLPFGPQVNSAHE
jgi:WD40 repeat protein